MAAERPSNLLLHPSDGSAQTVVGAATLRRKWHIKLAASPSHGLLTPGQPVLVLTLQFSGRAVQVFTNPRCGPTCTSPTGKAGFNPRVSRSRSGTLNHKATDAKKSQGLGLQSEPRSTPNSSAVHTGCRRRTSEHAPAPPTPTRPEDLHHTARVNTARRMDGRGGRGGGGGGGGR